MPNPYIGEIQIFAGNYAPAGWEFCEGQLLPIATNATLFQVIGTTYGGDGQATFALPDLRGRVPIHQGNGFVVGETGGVEAVALTTNQIPSHTHVPLANSGNGTSTDPANNFWAAQPALLQYSGAGSAFLNMPADTLSSTGGSQPHENFQPYICLNFIISLYGLFPSAT